MLLLGVLKRAEDTWPGSLRAFSDKCWDACGHADDCQRCCSLFQGLSSLNAFQGAKLPVAHRQVQHEVDCLVRKLVRSREEAVQLGYNMGAVRWNKAGSPDVTFNPGGRPSKVDCPETIKAVQAALDQHSQPSSSVCQKGDALAVVNTLTSNPTAVFNKAASVKEQISVHTYRRILRKHLQEYKAPRTLSDFCQHCAHLEDSVLPDIRKALEHWEAKLSGIMGSYFEDWKSFVANSGLNFEEQPGLYLSDFEHYIKRHGENKPCVKHADSSFPCGRFDLRKRGRGFPQGKRLELHDTEAAASYELRAHLKLLLGYLHHRAAKEVQHAAITSLLEAPPLGTAVLLSDWKELETCWKQTRRAINSSPRPAMRSAFGVPCSVSTQILLLWNSLKWFKHIWSLWARSWITQLWGPTN